MVLDNASSAQLSHQHSAGRRHANRQSMWSDNFHYWQTKTVSARWSADPLPGLVARFYTDAPERRLL